MPKILIVDDDRTTVKLLQTLLELDGFEVVVAGRGEVAFDLAHEQQPDVMLVDFHLIDMGGAELVAKLREEDAFAATPIVMVSGLNMEPEAMRAGANLFLEKPFEPSKLADLFLGMLGQQ